MMRRTTVMSDDDKIVSITAKLAARDKEQAEVDEYMNRVGAAFHLLREPLRLMRESGLDNLGIARVLRVVFEELEDVRRG
jgi:hypothetical protein